MSRPISCTWTGEAFHPATPFQRRLAADEFGAGEVVLLVAEGERSMASHNHQFASITELWQNLPERLAEAPYAKSPETLRKHALIATGYADVESIDCGAKAIAERVAVTAGALATKAHGYAIVKVSGPVVRIFTPQSQSKRAMGAKTFQASKTAVLEWIDALLQGEAA